MIFYGNKLATDAVDGAEDKIKQERSELELNFD